MCLVSSYLLNLGHLDRNSPWQRWEEPRMSPVQPEIGSFFFVIWKHLGWVWRVVLRCWGGALKMYPWHVPTTRHGADPTSVDNIRCDPTSWRSPYLISAQSWASSQPSDRKPANRAISVMWRFLKVVQKVGGYDHTAVKRQLHSPLKCLLQLWPTVPPSSPVPVWGLHPNSPDSWDITTPPASLLIVEDSSADLCLPAWLAHMTYNHPCLGSVLPEAYVCATRGVVGIAK